MSTMIQEKSTFMMLSPEPSIIPFNIEADSDQGALAEVESDAESTDFLSMYLQENRGTALLTANEEVVLAQVIEAGVYAQERLVAVPAAHEVETLEYMVERGDQARSQLVQANVRLVINIAKRYRGQGLDFLDLIQEGNVGLLTAVDKFDYTMGNRFSTYATWWIRQSITRAISNFGRTIRIPANKGVFIRQIYRARRDFEQANSRQPTPEELAEVTELPLSRVKNLLQITMPMLSLEQPAGTEPDTELGYFVSDEDASQPTHIVANNLLSERIDELLHQLTEKEAEVICLRYGLRGHESHTLNEVGKTFNLSRERIRQIEKNALRKLRQPKLGGDLHAYLN